MCVFLLSYIFISFLLLSSVRSGVHRLVSHRCPPGAGPHVLRLLPLHGLGGHHPLPAGRLHPHLLLHRVLLPGQQPLLLLQTRGRRRGRSKRVRCFCYQPCQECSRLSSGGEGSGRFWTVISLYTEKCSTCKSTPTLK